MLKIKSLKKLVSIILTLCLLVVGIMPTFGESVIGRETLQATIRVERIAETDIPSQVVNFTQGDTAYDLLANQATVTGDDFVSQINGYPSAMEKGIYWMFRVNGKIPGNQLINEYVVKSGDIIEFYAIYYTDETKGDYAFFEKPSYEATVNSPIRVRLMIDTYVMEDTTLSVAGAMDEKITTSSALEVDLPAARTTDSAVTTKPELVIEPKTSLIEAVSGVELIKSVKNGDKATLSTGIQTDSQGYAEIVFDSIGTYILSATKRNSIGQEVISRPYTVIHVKEGSVIGDQKIVDADKEALTISELTDHLVTKEQLTLSSKGVSGETVITWKSSDTKSITEVGKVTRPSYPTTENKKVTLTATLKKGLAIANKTFELEVVPYTLEETEKDLNTVLNSLSTLSLTYGKDSNVVDLLNEKLRDKGRPDITATFILAVNTGTAEHNGITYIGDNGQIENWYTNFEGTGIRVAPVDVTFKCQLSTVAKEKVLRVVIPLDREKVIAHMIENDVNMLTEDSIRNENDNLENIKTDLILPSEIGGKKSFITWQSDSELIKINGSFLEGYTGQVSIPKVDTPVTLTATFEYRFSGDKIVTQKQFNLIIKAVEGSEVEQIKAELSALLDKHFTIEKFDYVAIKDKRINFQQDYKENKVKYNFKVPDVRRQLPAGVTYTQTSSNEDLFNFEVFESGFVNYVARVVRPNVGNSDQTANVNVTMTKKGVSVSREIPFTIAALNQEEINAEVALMEEVKAKIWEGINNHNNIDKDNICKDLKSIYGAYKNETDELVWARTYSEDLGVGIETDDLFINPDDPYDAKDSYKFEPAGIFSDVTLKLQKRPLVDTSVKFTTCLSSALLGKYAAIYPENQDLQKLYRNHVSLDLTVKALNPEVKAIEILGVDNFKFDSKTTNYNMLTNTSLTEAILTVSLENKGAELNVNGEKVVPDMPVSIPLTDGYGEIVVATKDSSQTRKYTIILVSKAYLEEHIAMLPEPTESDEIIFAQKELTEKLVGYYEKLSEENKKLISNSQKLLNFNKKLQEVIENNQNLILQKELDEYITANYTENKALLNYADNSLLDFNQITTLKIKLKNETNQSKYKVSWGSSDKVIADIYSFSSYANIKRDEVEDKPITLTATLTHKTNPAVTAKKEFSLIIKAYTAEEKTAAQNLVNEVLEGSSITYATGELAKSVKSHIAITEGKPADTSRQYDVSYTWTSTDEKVAKVNKSKGIVEITRPTQNEPNQAITLTLEVAHKYMPSVKVSKTFNFTVVAVTQEDMNVESGRLESIKAQLFEGIKGDNPSPEAITKNLSGVKYAKINEDGTIRWNNGSKKMDDQVEIEWISTSHSEYIPIKDEGWNTVAFKLKKRPNQGEADQEVILTAKLKSLTYPDKVNSIDAALTVTVKAYNAYLSSLDIQGMELTFDKNTLNYEIITPQTLEQMTFTPALENEEAELRINQQLSVSKEEKTISLVNGYARIEIKVEDGKEYSWSEAKAKNIYTIVLVSKQYLEEQIGLLPQKDEKILESQKEITELYQMYEGLTEGGKLQIVSGHSIKETYDRLQILLQDQLEQEVKATLNKRIIDNYVTGDKYITLGSGDKDKEAITKNFKLKKESSYTNYTAEWSCSSPYVNVKTGYSSFDGIVIRPEFEKGNQEVIVTLKMVDKKTSIFVTRDFTIGIKALDKEVSDSLKVELQAALDKCRLVNKDNSEVDFEYVIAPFKLIGRDSAYNFSFESDREDIVKPSVYEYVTNEVSRPYEEEGNQKVILTLSVTKEGSSLAVSKTFVLNVITLSAEETVTTKADFKEALKASTIEDVMNGAFNISGINNQKLRLKLPQNGKVKGRWATGKGFNTTSGESFQIATVIRPSIGQPNVSTFFELTLTHIGTGKKLVKKFDAIILADNEIDRNNELVMLKAAGEKLSEFLKGENRSLEEIMVKLRKPDSVSQLEDGSFLFEESGYHAHAGISFNGLYNGIASEYLNSNLSLKKRPDLGEEDVTFTLEAVLKSKRYSSPYIEYKMPVQMTIKAYNNLLSSIMVDDKLVAMQDKESVEVWVPSHAIHVNLSGILDDYGATMKINNQSVASEESVLIPLEDRNTTVKIVTDIKGHEKVYTVLLKKVREQVEEVIAAIENLPEVKDVALSHEEIIKQTMRKFESLTEEEKALVSNKEKLIDVAKKLEELLENAEPEISQQVKEVIAAIENLPEIKDVTLNHKEVIRQTMKKFEALTEEEKAFVSNKEKLMEVAKKLEELLENAKPEENKPSLGGGGGGGAPAYQPSPIEVKGILDSKGISYINLTEVQISQLAKMVEMSKPVVEIELKIPEDTKAVSLNIPQAILKTFAKSTSALKVDSDIGVIHLDNKTLRMISQENQMQDMTLSMSKGSTFNHYPKVNISINLGDEKLTDFAQGEVVVSMPYVVKQDEVSDNLTVYIINEKGYMKAVEDVKYDANTLCVVWNVRELGKFVIAEKGEIQDINFADISENNLRRTYIEVLAQKGILQGKSDHYFEPKAPITRAEFVTILKRIDGKTGDVETMHFKDVASKAWYADSVAWAIQTGITQGTSPNEFSPHANITQEEIGIMIERYMQQNKMTIDRKFQLADSKTPATREEVAEIIFKLIESIENN